MTMCTTMCMTINKMQLKYLTRYFLKLMNFIKFICVININSWNELRIESSNIYIYLGGMSLPNDKLLALMKRPGNNMNFTKY